jgi:uncharacterized protein
VQRHVRGLDGVLAQLGMADNPHAEAGQPPTFLGRFLWMTGTDAGWWEPTVAVGDAVTEGQVIGTITTLDGADLLQTITAPADGVPIFITSSPAVAAGGLLLGLGVR